MNHNKLSWNTHYLLTRIAVRPCAGLTGLTKVTSLEEFIALAGENLQDVIAANLRLPGEQHRRGNRSHNSDSPRPADRSEAQSGDHYSIRASH